jgi:hypothetical protein
VTAVADTTHHAVVRARCPPTMSPSRTPAINDHGDPNGLDATRRA